MLLVVRWQTALMALLFFFFNDPATTEIYPLSLHDALPIYRHRRLLYAAALGRQVSRRGRRTVTRLLLQRLRRAGRRDRKSTRLNSSHVRISYAVFCLKKKTRLQACRGGFLHRTAHTDTVVD